MGWPSRLGAVAACCLLSLGAFGREVAGWREWAELLPEGLLLSAKLDTGADTTSLGAAEVRHFQTHDGEWVAFRLPTDAPRERWLRRPLVRLAAIKRHGLPPEHRPVVRLGICLGGISKEVEVTLADRGRFDSALLIGRNFLAGELLVDAATSFTRPPACDGGEDGRAAPGR